MCVYEVFKLNQCVFMKYLNLIKEARDAQKALLPVLPPEEKAKHDLWFNAKMINESYYGKGNLLKEPAVTLNPQAKEFQPTMQQPPLPQQPLTQPSTQQSLQPQQQ